VDDEGVSLPDSKRSLYRVLYQRARYAEAVLQYEPIQAWRDYWSGCLRPVSGQLLVAAELFFRDCLQQIA
jgi:hypothetical protein